ncbi:MAG TPA: hypothetical protein VMK65_13800 [Longimicrobiales bacterium]|nr:hypothetical protein [Longimicrobiales bacterium]
MKKILLVVAGLGALTAIAGGFAGIESVLIVGAGAMLIALLLLPWVEEDVPPWRRRE